MPKINVNSRDPNASSIANFLQGVQTTLGTAVQTNSDASLNTLKLISTTANGALTVDSTVASSSTSTGAIVCAGGIGVAGNTTIIDHFFESGFIGRLDATGSKVISGGSTSLNGGNITLYGDSSAFNPGELILAAGISTGGITMTTLGSKRFTIDSTGYLTLGDPSMSISGDPSAISPLNAFPGAFTDTATPQNGTSASFTSLWIESGNLLAQHTGVTTTQAYTVYIDGPPTASTNMSITHSHSLGINGDIYVSSNLSNAPNSGFITTAPNGIFTDNATAVNGTSALWAGVNLGSCSLAALNTGVKTTNAYTLYVGAAPTAGTNMTITNTYSLGVAGATYFGGSTTYAGPIVVSNTTNATSTSTGSIVTAGGIGMAKDLFIGGKITGIGGSTALSIQTSGNANQLVLNTNGSISLAGTVASTSTTTGTLVCAGGVGIAGATYIGGILNVQNTTSGTSSAGAVVIQGGVCVGADGLFPTSYFGGATTFNKGITVNGTSSSFTNGHIINLGSTTAGATLQNLYSASTPASTTPRLSCSAVSTGEPRIWSNFTKTGNYTTGEDNYTEWFGRGTASSLTNTEGLRVGYRSAGSGYILETFASGTGVANPLTLQTQGHSFQLVLNTDGSVYAQNGAYVGGHTPITIQGAYLQWNRLNGDGRMYLVNQQGGGNWTSGMAIGSSDTNDTFTEWHSLDQYFIGSPDDVGYKIITAGVADGTNHSGRIIVSGNGRTGKEGNVEIIAGVPGGSTGSVFLESNNATRLSVNPDGSITIGGATNSITNNPNSTEALAILPGTFTDNATLASGTVQWFASTYIQNASVTSVNTNVGFLDAYNTYIDSPPKPTSPSSNVTITNGHSLGVEGDIYILCDSLINFSNPPSFGFLTLAPGATFTDNATGASSTSDSWAAVRLGASPVLKAKNTSVITTDAYTLYVDAAPTSGTNMTITNAYSLGVAGNAYFGGSSTLAGALDVTSATNATSTTTGSIITAGGVGIAKDTYMGGLLNVASTAASSSTTTGAIICAGGIGAAGNSYYGGTMSIVGQVDLLGTTTSTSTSTGTLICAGGAGITKDVVIGATLTVDSTAASTSNSTGALICAGGIGAAGNSYLGGQTFLGNSNISVDVTAATSSVAYLQVIPGTCTTTSSNSTIFVNAISSTAFSSGPFSAGGVGLVPQWGVFTAYVDVPPAPSALTNIDVSSSNIASLGINGNLLLTARVNATANDSILKIRTAGEFFDMTTANGGTNTNWYSAFFGAPTYIAHNPSVTVTNAYNIYIEDPPFAGTNATITNSYALGVNGNSIIQDHFLTTNLIGRLDDTSYKVITAGSADGYNHSGRIVLSGNSRSDAPSNTGKIEIIAGVGGTNPGKIEMDIGGFVALTVESDLTVQASYNNTGARATPGTLPSGSSVFTGVFLHVYGCAQSISTAGDPVLDTGDITYPVGYVDGLTGSNTISTTFPANSYGRIPYTSNGTSECYFTIPSGCTGIYKLEFTTQFYSLDSVANNVQIFPYKTATLPMPSTWSESYNTTKTYIAGNGGGDNDATISGFWILPLNEGDNVMIGANIRISSAPGVKWSCSRAGTVLLTLISY